MYTRTITPAYETIGNRRRFTGVIGELHDGGTLIHSQEYSTNGQAERALDALAYELLSFEHGLVDAMPVRCTTCGDDGDCPDCAVPAGILVVQMPHPLDNGWEFAAADNGWEFAAADDEVDIPGETQPSTPDGGGPPNNVIPLLTDCARVIRALLGGPIAGGGIIDDLRRVEARLVTHGW